MTYIMPLFKDEQPCHDCIEYRGQWCCTMNCSGIVTGSFAEKAEPKPKGKDPRT